MKATEKLTLDQVRELVNTKVKKAIDDRGATEFIDRHSIRAGVIEAMFDILVMNDPTEAAKRLYLVDVKYIMTKFAKVTDQEGIFVAEFHSESLCDDYVKHYNDCDPSHTYVKSVKITER